MRTVHSIGEALLFEAQHGIIPIPIRPGLSVNIHGIPHDLTRAEAEKIGRVIVSYAKEKP